MKAKRCIFLSIFLAGWFLLPGCARVVRVGTRAGYRQGIITREQKERYDRRAVELESAVRPMSDREEYYLGRAVAATVLGRYRLYHDQRLSRYLNQMGQALALASDRPLTYGGYHFAILDTNDVNALACPGGIILVTRGLLAQVENEEQLAAVLAHEVAHINHRDGADAIKRSRWVQVVSSLGADAARQWGRARLQKLASLFEGSVGDVLNTLLVNGYSRRQELAADQSAMFFMHRLGYDPHALPEFLAKLANRPTTASRLSFFTTHPGIGERLERARALIAKNHWSPVDHRGRDRRFRRYR